MRISHPFVCLNNVKIVEKNLSVSFGTYHDKRYSFHKTLKK